MTRDRWIIVIAILIFLVGLACALWLGPALYTPATQ